MCEIILSAVHSFVSTFSVELFISNFFLLGQSFAWTMPTRALLTYISVVLSACCFLVVITSDLLRSHRNKDLFPVCQWSVSVCSLKVTVHSMPCLAKIILQRYKLLSPLPMLSEMGTGTGTIQEYFASCHEDRTPNKCNRWNLSFLEGSRSFVIGFFS